MSAPSVIEKLTRMERELSVMVSDRTSECLEDLAEFGELHRDCIKHLSDTCPIESYKHWFLNFWPGVLEAKRNFATTGMAAVDALVADSKRDLPTEVDANPGSSTELIRRLLRCFRADGASSMNVLMSVTLWIDLIRQEIKLDEEISSKFEMLCIQMMFNDVLKWLTDLQCCEEPECRGWLRALLMHFESVLDMFRDSHREGSGQTKADCIHSAFEEISRMEPVTGYEGHCVQKLSQRLGSVGASAGLGRKATLQRLCVVYDWIREHVPVRLMT